jgi:hypothetical protein
MTIDTTLKRGRRGGDREREREREREKEEKGKEKERKRKLYFYRVHQTCFIPYFGG